MAGAVLTESDPRRLLCWIEAAHGGISFTGATPGRRESAKSKAESAERAESAEGRQARC
jgi:hypothetical protein